MGLSDLTFRSWGMLTLGIVWPAFLVFIAGQIAFVSYVRRHGPPTMFWAAVVVIAAAAALAALGIISERTSVQLAAREALPPLSASAWERLFDTIRWTTGPTLWIFALSQVVLITRPRSHVVVAMLTAMSGTALSWAVAIWLGQQPLPEILPRLFRLPGTFGIVVSLLGFAVSSGIWAVTTHLGSRSLSNPGVV